MRRWLSPVLLVLGLVATAAAQSPSPAPSPGAGGDAAAQLTALLNKSPGKVFAVTADKAGETGGDIVAAFGELGTGSLADAANTAKAFVTSYGKVFGFPDGAPLSAGDEKLFREYSDDTGKFLQYCPAEGGANFFVSGMTVFVFKPNGNLVGVIGRYRPIQNVAGGDTSMEQAITIAREEIKKTFPEERDSVTGDGEVAQYLCEMDAPAAGGAPPTAVTLRIFAVTLKLGDPSIPKRCFVTANGGKVLMTEDARAFNNSAHIFEKDYRPVYSTTTHDLDDLVDPGFWPSWKINGTHFKVDPRITPSIDRASAWTGWFNDDPLASRGPNPAFCEEQVYYHLQEARKKALSWGATTDLALKDPVFFNHWKSPKCGRYDEGTPLRRACQCFQTSNAWFDPADTSMNFAATNPRLSNQHTSFDATFIVHEYGHLIHKLMSPHFTLGWRSLEEKADAGSVAEAVADLFSCTVLNTSKWGDALAKAVGPCDPSSSASDEDLSRDLDVERLYPAIKTHPDIHERGRAFSSAVWKLRKDSTLSPDELIKTTFASMRLCPLPSHFRHIALSFLAADQMLAGTPHTQKIFDLFKTHGLLETVKTSAAP